MQASKGNPLTRASGNCQSLLRILRAASTHYPLLRRFLSLLYRARCHQRIFHQIDTILCAGDFKQLMELAGTHEIDDLFIAEVDSCEVDSVSDDSRAIPRYSVHAFQV